MRSGGPLRACAPLLPLLLLGCEPEPAVEAPPVAAPTPPAGHELRPHVPVGVKGPPVPGQVIDPARIPLPTHPVANAVEALLLEYVHQGDQAALGRAAALITTEPELHLLPYMRMLQAYVAELRSPGSADELLAAMRPEVRATWEYYFRRTPRELEPYLSCGALANCLMRQARLGQPVPGADRFLDRSWDSEIEPVVLECEDRVVDTATCPDDYNTFERIRWVSQGEVRLSHWAILSSSAPSFAQFAELVGVVPGARVADIGAGIGVFAFPFAEAVGSEGRVWAVEIEPHLVEFMNWRKGQGGFDNLEVVLSRPDALGLEPGSVDVAVLCELLAKDLLDLDATGQEVDHFGAFLASVRETLKPDGVVVIIDHCVERTDDASCAPIVQRKLAEQGLVQRRVIEDFMPVQLVEVYGLAE